MRMCRSFRIFSSRYKNSFTVLEWAPVRLLIRDKSTCSSRSMSLSDNEDQASLLNMRPLQSFVSLSFRPIWILKLPDGISDIRPIICCMKFFHDACTLKKSITLTSLFSSSSLTGVRDSYKHFYFLPQ